MTRTDLLIKRLERELEQLKAIVTVASTSDVENVIIVKPSE